jgi:hypothetical protein
VRRRATALVAVAATLAACGVGAGDAPDSTVRLTVTDGFGARTVLERPAPEVRGNDTVMRVLQRNARVQTRHGGAFVQAINGLRGGREGARRLDWFYYVNGVLAGEGAASTKVNPGDRIWWDRHDWGATLIVPAVVGSFPEPFVHGVKGERIPTRLECEPSTEAACEAVEDRLVELDLPVGRALPGTTVGDQILRIVVGPWREIRTDRALRPIEQGPQRSGVYGRMDPSGRALTVLDQRGRAVRTLRAGTGLIAATRVEQQAPTWTVTGTDARGVAAAARAFQESALNEKYALAISDDLPVALPQVR